MALSTIPTKALTEQGINFRNLIINGDMSIAQRGTSSTGITGTGYHTCDRWNMVIGNIGTYTISQDTDVPTGQGFSKSFKIDCTTADASPASSDALIFRHRLEGQFVQHLKYGTSNAESLTLSFWVKCNKTGTGVVNYINHNSSRFISGTYTINSADTWEKKTITIDGDTVGLLNNNNDKSLQIDWWLDSGSDYNTGTFPSSWTTRVDTGLNVNGTLDLADSTSNYINITGVQLEVGTSASDFEFLPYDVNLRRCYRYCVDLIKGNQEDGAANEPICNGRINNADQFTGILVLPTEMRANPSLVVNNISGNFYVGAGGNGGLISSLNGSETLRRTVEVEKSSMGLSLPAGDGAVLLTANSNSILRAEAEL